MKRGKYEAPRPVKARPRFNKGLALMLALVLAVGGVVGGTLAWLTAKTDPVTNTFTTSDISITLTQAAGTQSEGKYSFAMTPGYTITVNPTVTVQKGSVASYLYVKLEKSAGFDACLSYSMSSGWEPLTDSEGNAVEGVYFRKVGNLTNSDTDGVWAIFAGNQITVKETVTSETPSPTLTITAYASQRLKSNGVEFSAYEAWTNVQSELNPAPTP